MIQQEQWTSERETRIARERLFAGDQHDERRRRARTSTVQIVDVFIDGGFRFG